MRLNSTCMQRRKIPIVRYGMIISGIPEEFLKARAFSLH